MNELRVNHVLMPVDLGHSSEAALRCAQTLVSALGAKLTLMYVNDALTLQSYDEIYTGYRELPEEQEDLMEDAVRQWAHPIIGRVPYDVIVVADDPVRGIATAAARHEADLIIMGTHARHGLQRFFGGSLAEAVLHHTDRPVLTVPQTAETRLADIVCPVNFTEVAQRAARAACCMSRAVGSRLHMVHVAGHSEPDLAQRLRSWTGGILSPECEVAEIIVRGGTAAERIVQYAGDVNADVIVLGAQRRRHGERAAVGTTTEAIMRISPTAVMSVVRPMTDANISAA